MGLGVLTTRAQKHPHHNISHLQLVKSKMEFGGGPQKQKHQTKGKNGGWNRHEGKYLCSMEHRHTPKLTAVDEQQQVGHLLQGLALASGAAKGNQGGVEHDEVGEHDLVRAGVAEAMVHHDNPNLLHLPTIPHPNPPFDNHPMEAEMRAILNEGRGIQKAGRRETGLGRGLTQLSPHLLVKCSVVVEEHVQMLNNLGSPLG